MTDSHQIHQSFKNVAPLQSYAIDHLIATAVSRQQDRSRRLEETIARIQKLMETDKDTGLPLFHYASWDMRTITKAYVDSHNVALILRSMKSNGVERLELDTSKDMYEQILSMARTPQNRPKNFQVAANRICDGGGNTSTSYFLIPAQEASRLLPPSSNNGPSPKPDAP